VAGAAPGRLADATIKIATYDLLALGRG